MMNTISRFVDSLWGYTTNVDQQTFGVVAVLAVIFGYFMLRGDSIRKAG